MTDSQHYKVGIVTEIEGNGMFATNPKGEARQLTVGSAVYSDDSIESRDNSSMIVQTTNGQSISIPEDVYDQMLSNAISKELSQAIESVNENADAKADPHSQHQNNAESYALETKDLNIKDLLCFEEDSLNNLLNESSEQNLCDFSSLNTLSFQQVAALTASSYDYSTEMSDDYSAFFFGC